jgi:hypothetical protein
MTWPMGLPSMRYSISWNREVDCLLALLTVLEFDSMIPYPAQFTGNQSFTTIGKR